MDRNITQYMQRFSAPDAQALLHSIVPYLRALHVEYHTALCIPAYAEDEPLEKIWHKTLQDPSAEHHLVIIYGNWPKNASQHNIQTTMASLARLESISDSILAKTTIQRHPTSGERLQWCLIQASPSLLLIQSDAGLEPSQGVGLARKITMDICLGLFQQELLQNPWVGTTDADAILPPDYWRQIQRQHPPGLVIFTFDHRFDDERADAPEYKTLMAGHHIYQAYLQHYVKALTVAMPEFAFHSIGSLFALHLPCYAQVRGYPPLAAGEDFYMMNKMAKTATITQLTGDAILLRPRLSQRTPFGTGPSVMALMATTAIDQAPLFYDPKCLKLWQESLLSLRQFEKAQHWSSFISPKIKSKLAHQYKQCTTQAQKTTALISLMDGLRCQQLLRKMHHNTARLSWQAYCQLKSENTQDE